MAKKDKILDVMAMVSLPLDARIKCLAAKQVGKPLPRQQALAIIDCYFPERQGQTHELVRRLLDEKARQEKIHNGRMAEARASTARAQSPMLKYRQKNIRGVIVPPNHLLELTAYCARVLLFGATHRQNPRPMYGSSSTWC